MDLRGIPGGPQQASRPDCIAVDSEPPGCGRPPAHWALASHASELFPDRHADLTVDLIESIRHALGDEALEQVVQVRAGRQLAVYRQALDGTDDTLARVRRLADLRTAEGYLADTSIDGDSITLVEHHCPIHAAASACGGLCSAELELFRSALGSNVTVTRDQHVMAGARRCSYRITPIA